MRHVTDAPSAKQLRYLRNLAVQRGETFSYPQSATEASNEIERLLGRRRSSRVERRVESLQISRRIAEAGDGAAVRDSEIVGYGSSCRWSHKARS